MISEVRDQISLHILLIILTLDLCLIALDVMSNANEHLGIIAVSDNIQIMLSLKEETSIELANVLKQTDANQILKQTNFFR